MTRRPRLLLATGALAAALALTSCSTFTDNDAVARVGDEELSQGELGELVRSELVMGLAFRDPEAQVVDGDEVLLEPARVVVGIWAQAAAIDQSGLLTDELRSEAETTAVEAFGAVYERAGPVARDLAVVSVAATLGLQQGQYSEEQLRGAVAAEDIRLDSRYGYWDPETYRVLALGRRT